VMFAFFLAVTFLPAFSAVMPVRAKVRDAEKATTMDGFANFVINFRRPLFWTMGVVMVGLALIAPKNELNDVFVHYFDESVPFRVEVDEITDKLSGLYIVDFSVDSKEEGGVSGPEFLADVEKFENYLLGLPEVQHVSAITETMRRLNRSMHGDDEAFYKLPESRELSAQYLLLYEMSLPYGLDLNNQINFDKSTTRISATLETVSTNEMLRIEQESMDWMRTNTPNIASVPSGPTIMFSHIGMRNIISMLSGTGIALVLISLILVFALRSVKFGAVSLIPNIAPALMAFGVWYMLVGEVGLAVSVVVAMTLGIVVDDTIHFLSKYLRARRERGMNAEDAIRYAFNTVGVALTVTTIVLVAGFMVIAQSNFQVNSQMGLLTAITIAIALIVDFLFLPSLLLLVDGDKKTEGHVAVAGTAPQGA
jgi:predicted RND superfamily exporter protein